jgi:hypothetical protein
VRRLALVLLLASGCGVLSQEEQLLTDVFEAARLHDTTALATMSGVTFNPRTRGVVQDFTVERSDGDADGQSKTVVILAQVRTPAGEVAAQRMRATIVRRHGRWFVSELTTLGAAGS